MKDRLISLIAGPTDRTKIVKFGRIREENYHNHLESIARAMLGQVEQINIIPDEGVPLDFSKIYRKLGGMVVGYVPQGDRSSLEKIPNIAIKSSNLMRDGVV